MAFRIFHTYFNLPWEHNLERTSSNTAKVLKGTEYAVTSTKIAALVIKYEWKKAAEIMDTRISGQIRRGIEKSAVVSVSKYMSRLETILDRFWVQVEEADPQDVIITSISDLEKLIKLQVLLANTPENGAVGDEGGLDNFMREESRSIDLVRRRIEESARSTASVAKLMDDEEAVDVYFEES